MNSTQSRKRCHLIAECIRFHSKIDRKFPLGQDDAGSIDALLASERELRRELSAAKRELKEYANLKEWAVRVDEWHTKLCRNMGIKPVHPAGCLLKGKGKL